MGGRSNETKATAPVAERATLAAPIAVTKAYSVTDGASMLGRMLRTARRPSKLAAVLSVLATIAVIAWRIEPGIQIAAFALVASVFWFRRDAFRDYYGKKRTATFLDTFSRRDQAFRYVMFREHVPEEIAKPSHLAALRETFPDAWQPGKHPADETPQL